MTTALLALLASLALGMLARGAASAGMLRGIGVALLAGGGALMLARQPGLAALAATLGAAALARAQRAPGGRRSSGGGASSVRSAVLEMMLDHDSGAMDGRVLSGAFAGRLLSELSLEQLLALAASVEGTDAQTLTLLRAYLDRVHPAWRDEPGAAPEPDAARSAPEGMTVERALRILGLRPGASQEEIAAAYRRLIKRVHPDVGGSEALVQEVTDARDLLLTRR